MCGCADFKGADEFKIRDLNFILKTYEVLKTS